MCTFSMEHILSNALMNIIKCGFGFARIQIKGIRISEGLYCSRYGTAM